MKDIVWIENDLSAFRYNLTRVKRLIGKKTKIMAMLKGNAYGHGVIPFAKEFERLGGDAIGLARMCEAQELRRIGITLPILILSYLAKKDVPEAITQDIAFLGTDEHLLSHINAEAKKQKKKALLHIEVDTGMHRVGLTPDVAIQFLKACKSYPWITVSGIYTHFATADEHDLTYTNKQLKMFEKLLQELRNIHLCPPLIHAANSPASLRLPASYYSMVRPGKVLFGLLPYSGHMPFTPRPVLSLKAVIGQIILINKGESVGYNRQFIAPSTRRIATLPIGYTDGIRLGPSPYQQVLIRGQKAPIIGQISMDHTAVDVTDIQGVKRYDVAVLIGKQGKERITIEDIAKEIGTSNDEVVAKFSVRVPRYYKA